MGLPYVIMKEHGNSLLAILNVRVTYVFCTYKECSVQVMTLFGGPPGIRHLHAANLLHPRVERFICHMGVVFSWLISCRLMTDGFDGGWKS